MSLRNGARVASSLRPLGIVIMQPWAHIQTGSAGSIFLSRGHTLWLTLSEYPCCRDPSGVWLGRELAAAEALLSGQRRAGEGSRGQDCCSGESKDSHLKHSRRQFEEPAAETVRDCYDAKSETPFRERWSTPPFLDNYGTDKFSFSRGLLAVSPQKKKTVRVLYYGNQRPYYVFRAFGITTSGRLRSSIW